MKIAVFSDFFLPAIDGIVTSLEQLVIEFGRQGHQVLLIAPHCKGAPKYIGENVEIFYLPSIPVVVHPTWHFSIISPQIIRRFKDFNPDVVQIATPANVGLMGIFLAKQNKVPLVGVFHTYFMKPEYLHWVIIKQGTKFIEQIGWKLMELVFKPCEIIISPAESVKEDLIKHGISRPLVVCNNGLHFAPEVEDTQLYGKFIQKYKIVPENTLLYIGRLSKEKNLINLIKIFYSLSLKKSDVRLLLVGDGPLREELETLVRLYDIEEKVIFVGEVKHDYLFKIGILKMAKLFVTSSTSEVQPMSIIEALFYGLPIVAYSSQGMTDLIDDKKNGFLIEPGNVEAFVGRIIQVLDEKELYSELSKNALKKASKFTVSNSAKSYLKVFREVLSTTKS